MVIFLKKNPYFLETHAEVFIFKVVLYWWFALKEPSEERDIVEYRWNKIG